MPQPINIFVVYAQKDKAIKQQIVAHINPLKTLFNLTIWHDEFIQPGQEWEAAIREKLEQTDLFLLLVSVDFINSEFITKVEFKEALERYYDKKAMIIPVIIKHCVWDSPLLINDKLFSLSQLQVLPENAKPISDWKSPEEAYNNIAHGVRRVLKGITNKEKIQEKVFVKSIADTTTTNPINPPRKTSSLLPIVQAAAIVLGICTVVLLILIFGFNIFDNENALTHVMDGQNQFDNRNYDKALKEFTKAIKDDSNYQEAYKWRGKVYIQQKKYGEAIQDLTKAIDLDPSDTAAYSSRGYAYLNSDEFGKAAQDFTKVIQASDENIDAHYNRGVAIASIRGDSTETLKDFTKVLEVNPSYTKAWFYRGNVYADYKEYRKAISDYDRAIGLDPSNASFYFKRGVAHFMLSNYEEAKKDYYNSLLFNKGDTTVYFYLGMTYDYQGMYDSSINNYTRHIELKPTPYGYDSRGKVYHEQAKYSEAIYDYTEAIRLDPKATYYNDRAMTHEKMGNDSLALKDYTTAIQRDAGSAESYHHRGDIYNKLLKNDEACADYKKAKELGDKDISYDLYNNCPQFR